MATYSGTSPEGAKQKIWGHLAPYPGGTYPTHHAANMKGGYRTMSTEVAMHGIPISHKKHGMKVYCSNTNRTWRLSSNLTTWVHVPDASAGSILQPFTRTVEIGSSGSYHWMEKHVYPEGRMEWFIKSFKFQVSATFGTMTYREIHGFGYSQDFVGLPYGTITVEDQHAGICWASFYSSGILANFFAPQLLATGSGLAGGVLHMHMIGRWK